MKKAHAIYNFRNFLSKICCLLLLSELAFAAPATTGELTPNIVLIVADYMGYSDIGPYGASDIRTPALDTLAREGVRFSNYYAAAPVCSPSRAALLSGYYPAKVGLENNGVGGGLGLSARYSTMVRELKGAGYKTAAVGKWHLGQGGDNGPLAHGFDSFLGFHTWTIGYHTHRTQNGLPGLYRDEELTEADGYLTDIFSDEASQFIESSGEDPFFLYLAYNTALPPYQGPDLPQSEWETGWDVNQASRSDVVAMVEAMDRGIGQVLESLEQQGVADNTLVIFTHDHGGRHLVRSDPLFHGFATLWEGGIRVPLIMRWPDRLGPDQTVATPTIAMDITATVLDAAARESATFELDGSSLFPVIENPEADSERTLFWRFGAGNNLMKAVRSGDWKLVIDRGTQLLFNLEDDIGERQSVFALNTEVASSLRARLTDWEQSLRRLP